MLLVAEKVDAYDSKMVCSVNACHYVRCKSLPNTYADVI